jgi:hypothetical protein
LPEEEWLCWQDGLQFVDMPLGAVLYESGIVMSHVYFPTTAVVALLYELKDGSSAEIAVVGNEGIVGVSLFMGGESTPSRAVVQCAGKGFRLSASLMQEQFNQAGPVLHLLLLYTQALITQMVLTAACNRHHSSDEQMCRWLLLSLDHLGADELLTTPAKIANMLDARRGHLTPRARGGNKDVAWGHITLLDRESLEERTCECYSVIKNEYGRLLMR